MLTAGIVAALRSSTTLFDRPHRANLLVLGFVVLFLYVLIKEEKKKKRKAEKDGLLLGGKKVRQNWL